METINIMMIIYNSWWPDYINPFSTHRGDFKKMSMYYNTKTHSPDNNWTAIRQRLENGNH